MIERRKHVRHPVRIAATLVSNDGLVRLSAEIRDASREGARMVLADMANLPERFYVLFNNRIEPCRLVWQNKGEIGLAYEDLA